MQPEQVNLIRQFVEAYDSEHSMAVMFRGARTRVIHEDSKNGFMFSSSSLVRVCNGINGILKRRADFIWDKAKEVITTTGNPAQEGLAADFKALLREFMVPHIQYAKREFKEACTIARCGEGHIWEAIQTSENILLRLEADIDLFCAQFKMKPNQQRKGDASLAKVRTLFKDCIKAYDEKHSKYFAHATRDLKLRRFKRQGEGGSGGWCSEDGKGAIAKTVEFIEDRTMTLWAI